MTLQTHESYFFDTNRVRYELYQSNGGKNCNWLLFPGGPGADSSYLRSLVDLLDLPGNVWLIDFPGSGSNIDGQKELADFDKWLEFFPAIIQKFENPVLVGHSFGGMLPLLFPELENQVKGLVILNSAPSLWLEAAVEYAKDFDLPDLSREMTEFTENPCQDTFDMALDACMPYYFPPESLEEGKALLTQIPFQYLPAVWWQRKAMELNYSAKWVPKSVPTLIVGAKYDCMCPFTIFQDDDRFQRDNIDLLFLDNAGHCGWLDAPNEIKSALEEFARKIEVE